ncbi:MAG TPA: hypothetical protein EYP25_08610 [Anaerolineae bacterium]|nr:hypothetical protein [Anaerolineae bacterium]
MATLEALKNQVTLVPSTPVGGEVISPMDYVGLVNMACQIVKENYVRGNFNGVNWDDVCQRYVKKAVQVKTQKAFWELMTAMIAELHDNHSRFVPPKNFSREFGLPSTELGKPWPGMIVWPAREDPFLFIWDVCEVGGAHDAGLHRGDIILAVEGEEVVKGPDGFDEALIDKIYQGDGRVRMRVWQGPDETPRDMVVSYGGASGCDGWGYAVVMDDPYIGYIRVPEYSPDADVNILSMIESLEEERPLDGLIYDQRHNPGGFADKAIAIFTQGTFGKRGKLREDATLSLWRVRGPVKWNETTPMIVLSDGASHSAAEYFAIAMKLSKRATLVGMPTAGNTEGITGFSLPDGSLIRLAVETLILPDGSTMEGIGVEPDVWAPLGQWGLRQDPDVQLQKAIETLRELLH